MEAAGKRYIIHGSRADVFDIYNLADLHLMAKACAEGTLRADVKKIADDPFSFWFGGGDYVDFIGYSDKRFDPDAVAEDVSIADLGRLGEVGMTRARDILAPIGNKSKNPKCLGMLLGNHEKHYQLKTEHEGLHGWLCTELGAVNLQYSAFVDVVFCRVARTKTPRLVAECPAHGAATNRHQVRFYLHHGCGYAVTPGGKLNRLTAFMNSFQADVYMAGHVHDQLARRQPIISANKDCTELEHRDRVGVVSGSYLRTYAQGSTTYGEQRGFAPVNLGAAKVTIEPDKKRITAGV